METFLENVIIDTDKNKLKEDDTLKIRIYAKLNGKIREVFSPDIWEKAYDKGERRFLLRYYIEIFKKEKFLKKLILKDKIVRKATFFWTRNPTIENRIWVMYVSEEKKPYLPSDAEEIKDKLFVLKKEYLIDNFKLGKGKHEIFAVVKAKWGNYEFIEKGEVKAKSNKVKVECY
jgi:hypothetical protein